MKRAPYVLAVLVIVLATAAATAQARSVVAERASASRQAVVSYWTAERMRSAKPVERSKPGSGGTSGSTTFPFTSYEVPAPYTAFPTSTHGKVFFVDGSFNYVCSGTALASGNESVVWTAGHCVNDGSGEFHANWAFVPAYRDGVRPFGTFAARTLYTTAGWAGGRNFGVDLGAAAVHPVDGATLTATVGGGRGVAFDYERAQTYKAYGYPAAKKYSGQRLRVCEAPRGGDDTSVSPPSMAIGCDQTGGSSGGGWLVGNDVHSVNSYGYSSLRNVMFGPYQGAVAQELFATAAAG